MSNRIKKWNMIAVFIAAFIVAIAMGELAGWPFLAKPLAKQLSILFARDISFEHKNSVNSTQSAASENPESLTNKSLSDESKSKPFQVRFLGGFNLETASLRIAKPDWSKKPYFLQAENLSLKLRYIDIWRAYKGENLRIESLRAKKLEGYIERLNDGRASWQFKDKPTDPDKPVQLPIFGELILLDGLLHVNDAPLNTQIEAKLALENRTKNPESTRPQRFKNLNTRLRATATGTYQKLPLKIDLVSIGELSKTDKLDELPVAMKLNATVGRASLHFRGRTKDIMRLDYFVGSFTLKGQSLASVGDLFGVTLPTTAAFNTNGNIEKEDLLWRAKVNHLLIGESDLNGQFTYDQSLKTPLLKGKLGGKKLVITDLGPAFGSTEKPKSAEKVLPTRPFDLASLRVMNADVLIDIQYLDLKTRVLQPLNPLQGHLKLNDAVLTLNRINASTADGLLKGDMRLDGRGKDALWDADLRWSGVRLEQWIKQTREADLPPYIAGKLHGSANIKGQGRSTAEILASLSGDVRSELRDGAVSHLGIEVAGLDLAQSVGVLFKGDDALPMQCAVVDLHAEKGTFTPRVMVVDTADTTVWVDGSLSLATETLNLRAMALPKDFSPLAVRVPVNVTGPFANPKVSLEKKPIGLKLAASALLAIINPLAAVIPLFDTGDTEDAKQRADGCASLMKNPR